MYNKTHIILTLPQPALPAPRCIEFTASNIPALDRNYKDTVRSLPEDHTVARFFCQRSLVGLIYTSHLTIHLKTMS